MRVFNLFRYVGVVVVSCRLALPVGELSIIIIAKRRIIIVI